MSGSKDPRPPHGKPPTGAPRPVRSGSRSKLDRDEARRRRIEAERQEAQRIRRRRALVAGGLVVALVLLVVLEVFVHRLNGEEKALLDRAPAAASAAGCTGIRTIRPYPGGHDRFHVGAPPFVRMPPLSTYPSTPPASGPHAPVPLDAGVYNRPPAIDSAIHSLEHAAVIIWYDPAASSSPELQRIRAFFRQGGEGNHVVVAPYSYPGQGTAGKLPSGQQMAVVAWHHVRYCARPSLAVAFDFAHRYRFNLYQWGAYEGDAPEKFAPI
jgi:hypothetical protein